jgi:hypothetical protein
MLLASDVETLRLVLAREHAYEVRVLDGSEVRLLRRATR